MVSVGSRALQLRRAKSRRDSLEYSLMMGDEEDLSYKKENRHKGMNRKPNKDRASKDVSGHGARTDKKSQNFSNQRNASKQQTPFVRKQVDPEAAKYFSEIANLFESNGVDLEERSVICGNALEETRGKEVELATDYIISHTLQNLLEGCDLDHLCSFLRSCAKDFPSIAMDRSGSHVAETALKSLSLHLEDTDSRPIVEDTLNKICQAIFIKPVDMICNCYGSHVLRRMLCLCKGISLDSPEFHTTKTSRVLAERLNFKESQHGNSSHQIHEGLSGLLKFLLFGMLKNCTSEDIANLEVDHYGSLVLQTAMKLLVGLDDELLHLIQILVCCNAVNIGVGDLVDVAVIPQIVDSLKETSFSHLMEVILEVAPETVYDEFFTKIFRNSLLELSSDNCGNFVVQALISHARSKDQIEMIWEELGPKFEELLGMGRSGVIASLISASQRLNTHEQKCCKALAGAVCSTNESSVCIVPRILFLESYFFSDDKSNWNWPTGGKMHVMGSLVLQAIFRYPSDFTQSYIHSITSMGAEHVLQMAKDASGARVLEAFLSSDASLKNKRKLVVKLREHFGELSMFPSSSYTVEKCYTVSNISLREIIVSELLAMRAELSKTRQGPHLLRKLDVDGFARHPDQWRSKQESKQSVYKEFHAAFGSSENKASNDSLAKPDNHSSDQDKMKKMRKEIDDSLASSSAIPPRASGTKRHQKTADKCGGKISKHAVGDDVSKRKGKKLKKRKHSDE